MITKDEYLVLKTIKDKNKVSLDELSKKFKINIDKLRGIIEELKRKDGLKTERHIYKVVVVGDRLLKLKSLPEIIIYEYIKKIKTVSLQELKKNLSFLDDGDIKAGVGRLIKLGIIKIRRDKDTIIEHTFKGYDYKDVKKLLELLLKYKKMKLSEINKKYLNIIQELCKRPDILYLKDEKIDLISPGPKINELLKSYRERFIITKLTPNILVSGAWRNSIFKPYNLNEKTYIYYPGRVHPLRELIREIREIFISMGFEEAEGPLIELSFINFDILFQPQDHPARDMQDTFYIKHPERGKIPFPENIINNVKSTHINGWITGSKGWRYKWRVDEAEKYVLRTHTTAVTIREVYEIGEREARIFSIGRVFRNETIDYKHLAEFMQVDGIIISKNGNLRELMGIIKEFYSRMGFKDIKFWPSYFPYTEPSIQPSIYIHKWRKWLELGGAGIFRPEVTIPLGVKWPVLAWGLGLERLLMIKYDIRDIRDIYRNNLGWLRTLVL